MFQHSVEFEKGIRVMNAIEDGKFPLMLNRIAQFLATDTSAKPFTDAEESKLETSLEMSGNEVKLLVNATIEIFSKCAYHMIKPSGLSEQLQTQLNISQKKADAFVQVWTSYAKRIVDNLKQKSFFLQLSHMSYILSVETASDFESREKLPRAQLQLGLSSDKQKEDVSIEFSHDELYNFYRQLEQIQEQLDTLR